MNKFDELIIKTNQMANLAVELRETALYESCDYHVVQVSGSSNQSFDGPDKFSIYRISDETEVRYGTKSYCRTWLERRSIPASKVYKYNLIAAPEDTG